MTYLATFIVILFVGGGQEEPGWRGFALPRLQEQFGPLPASLALGALWGIWHLPLFILVPNYDNAGYRPGQIATTFIIFAGDFMVGLSLLLTWLFNQTNGSVLLAMLAHASVNTTLGFSPMTRSSTIISFLSILAIGAFIAIATRGRLGYRKQIAGRSPDGQG